MTLPLEQEAPAGMKLPQGLATPPGAVQLLLLLLLAPLVPLVVRLVHLPLMLQLGMAPPPLLRRAEPKLKYQPSLEHLPLPRPTAVWQGGRRWAKLLATATTADDGGGTYILAPV
ncbi:unnamed protein product [Ectocarpus sp. 8 AP-2014]